MRNQCAYCGRYFVPDARAGDRQKTCQSEGCRRNRKQEAQRRWLAENPGYFRGRYDYVKEWRRRRRSNNGLPGKMIQDARPPSNPMHRYILLIPEARAGVIQDEIVLRRLDGSTFAAYG